MITSEYINCSPNYKQSHKYESLSVQQDNTANTVVNILNFQKRSFENNL